MAKNNREKKLIKLGAINVENFGMIHLFVYKYQLSV